MWQFITSHWYVILYVRVFVSTGKTPASPCEYGSFGELFRSFLYLTWMTRLRTFIWVDVSKQIWLSIFSLSSWQWKHAEFRGHHRQRHLNRQQLWILGYGHTHKPKQAQIQLVIQWLCHSIPLQHFSTASSLHCLSPLGTSSVTFEWLWSLIGCLCVFLFIRTGAFQTSPNPKSPPPQRHQHWWHAAQSDTSLQSIN